MPEHFEMWIGYGIFFLAVTICQVLLALVLLAFRPVRPVVLWAGILGNFSIIAMWVIARTMGLPLGPMTGEIEAIGVLDLASKIVELGLIFCMVVLLRMKPVPGPMNDMAAALWDKGTEVIEQEKVSRCLSNPPLRETAAARNDKFFFQSANVHLASKWERMYHDKHSLAAGDLAVFSIAG